MHNCLLKNLHFLKHRYKIRPLWSIDRGLREVQQAKVQRVYRLPHMQGLLQNGEKIRPKQWKAEIQSLQSKCNSIGKEQTKAATKLAYVEVISYNRKNLERELQNESRQQNRQQSKTKRREEL